MADTIKIGSLDISAFKVGSDNCKIYLGDTLLYPKNVSYKLVAQYSNTTEYKVECNGSTALTESEVTSYTTSKTAMTSAVISNCGESAFKVGNNSFCGCTSLSSVTLSEGITQIGNQAFRDTPNLRSITFPSTLDTIEATAFRLSGLRNVSGIPSGVTTLGSGAFADCLSLTSATIPSSVTGSSTSLFLRDSGLTEVHFEGTTAPALGADAFNGCTSLVKIYIPSCDCYDSYAAQSQFSGKTNIIYGENEEKCKQESYPYAFRRTSRGGTAFTIACNSSSANSITSANTRSGMTTAQVTSSTATETAVDMIFGDCCAEIEENAASAHTYLTGITISSKVKKIKANAFANNYRVSSITFGRGGTLQLQNAPFKNMSISASSAPNIDFTKLASLTLDVNTNPTFQNCKINRLTLPKSITISKTLCSGCTIGILTIGSNCVLRSDYGAPFYYITTATSNKINNIIIENGVTSLPNLCFCGLKGATSINIPNSVVSIGSQCFYGSSLTSVTIGSGITSIGQQAFDMSSSHSLTVTLNATTPPTLNTNATSIFNSTNTIIYVPDASVNTYKTASYWSSAASWIKPISEKP